MSFPHIIYMPYKNKEERIKHQREYDNKPENKIRAKIRKLDIKYTVLHYYSNGTFQCKFCKYNDPRALALDHINNNGYKHRKEVKNHVYLWIIKNNFPNGFQVLCHNCNWIKRLEHK